MSKVKPSTKEQLIYFLISNLSLGTYDRRFLTNLETINLQKKKPLTSNQAELLDKIVLRYKRQLTKLEIDTDQVISLPWSIQPIKSLPQFTETHLYLIEDELILRSPYKNSFIKDFKKLDLHAKWEPDDRLWRIPANTYTLKTVKKCVEYHFEKVNYDEYITKLLDAISVLENSSWEPTYKYLNGNFYVLNINEHLSDALKDIPFDISLKTLSRLSSLGIKVDDTVIEKYKEIYPETDIRFSFDLVSKIDQGDTKLLDRILSLNPSLVVFSEYISSVKPYLSIVREELKQHNIPVTSITFGKHVNILKEDYVVLIESGMSIKQHFLPYVSKVVQIVNSNPITIK